MHARLTLFSTLAFVAPLLAIGCAPASETPVGSSEANLQEGCKLEEVGEVRWDSSGDVQILLDAQGTPHVATTVAHWGSTYPLYATRENGVWRSEVLADAYSTQSTLLSIVDGHVRIAAVRAGGDARIYQRDPAGFAQVGALPTNGPHEWFAKRWAFVDNSGDEHVAEVAYVQGALQLRTIRVGDPAWSTHAVPAGPALKGGAWRTDLVRWPDGGYDLAVKDDDGALWTWRIGEAAPASLGLTSNDRAGVTMLPGATELLYWSPAQGTNAMGWVFRDALGQAEMVLPGSGQYGAPKLLRTVDGLRALVWSPVGNAVAAQLGDGQVSYVRRDGNAWETVGAWSAASAAMASGAGRTWVAMHRPMPNLAPQKLSVAVCGAQ